MLKKGFTLQELLITMAIVGVVATLVIPQLSNMIPDRNKTMYMKAYNTLMNETADIISDSSLFPNDAFNGEEYEIFGLGSHDRPQVAPYSTDEHCENATKFPAILSHRLNIKGEATYPSNTTANFVTNDGINWSFDAEIVDIYKNTQDGYKINVTINVDPSDSNASHNCVYSKTCTKPNQFKFEIDNDGGVRAADALGIAYLQKSTDMHSAIEDRSLASDIFDEDVNKMYTKLNKNNKTTEDTTKDTTQDTTNTTK